MEIAFMQLLLQTTAITDIVGEKIDWSLLPQSQSLPAIVLHTIDGAPEYSGEGESGLFGNRIQVDCYGLNFESAKDLAKAVKEAVTGYSGILGDTGEQIDFQGIWVEDEQDGIEIAAGEIEVNRVRLDLTISYSEGE